MNLLECTKSIYELIISDSNDIFIIDTKRRKAYSNLGKLNTNFISFTQKLSKELNMDYPFGANNTKNFYKKSIMLLERKEKLKKILKNGHFKKF